MVAVVTSVVLFWPRLRRVFMWDPVLYDLAMLVMDSAGLGIFTVMGIRIAYEQVDQPGWFLLVFVGVVTGVGGGVLRTFWPATRLTSSSSTSMPAPLAGGAGMHRPVALPENCPLCCWGAGTVLAIRFLSAHFRWNLPHANS